MAALQMSPKIEFVWIGYWVDRPHFDNFLLKTLKLSWVAFYSLTF